MSKRIAKYSRKSSITQVKIKYGSEVFRFNLTDELSISELKINEELKEQPSYYGFLKMLQARLLTVKEDTEAESNKAYSSAYLKACETRNPNTNRNYSDKTAREIAIANDNYNKKLKQSIKAKEDYNLIDACVKAFEQRASLIQTLAANMRKENQ